MIMVSIILLKTLSQLCMNVWVYTGSCCRMYFLVWFGQKTLKILIMTVGSEARLLV